MDSTTTHSIQHLRCILPAGNLFSAALRRPLVPPELLMLQGIHANPVIPMPASRKRKVPDPLEWKWRELADLAGNAFSAHSLVAVVFAALRRPIQVRFCSPCVLYSSHVMRTAAPRRSQPAT